MSTVFAAALAFLQAHNLDFIFGSTAISLWNFFEPVVPSRIISTFGNRNYLGAFLVIMFFPILGYCLSQIHNFSEKNINNFAHNEYFAVRATLLAFFFSVIFLLAYVILVIRSRGAHLSFLAGGLMFFFFSSMVISGKKIVKNLFHPFGFITIFLCFFLITQSFPNPLNIFPATLWQKWRRTFLVETYDPGKSNTMERLNILFYCCKDLTEGGYGKLFTGFGLGSFKKRIIESIASWMPEDKKEKFAAVIFRQLHNDWFQFFYEFGLIGFLSGCIVLFLWLKTCLKFFFKSHLNRNLSWEKDRLILSGFLTSCLSFLLLSNVDFVGHQVASMFYFLFFFSVSLAICEKKSFFNPEKEEITTSIPPEFQAEISFPYLLLCLIICMLFLTMIQRESRIIKSDLLFTRARRIIQKNQKDDPGIIVAQARVANTLLMQAISLNSVPGNRWFFLAFSLLRLAPGVDINNIDKKKLPGTLLLKASNLCFNRAIANINFSGRVPIFLIYYHKAVLASFSSNSRLELNYLYAGLRYCTGIIRTRFYIKIGRFYFIHNDLDRARRWVNKCLKLKSDHIEALFLGMNILEKEKNWQELLRFSQRIINSKANDESLKYQRRSDFWRIQARAYFARRKEAEAFKALNKALDLGTRTEKQEIKKIYKYYSRQMEKKFLPPR
ncbi:hypothetical protein ACFL35_03075 [Candidatus Riflebacteria bacterium]